LCVPLCLCVCVYVVDDMKVTLEYDMSACLAAPRWMDGYQHFADIVYEPGLALLIDVRSAHTHYSLPPPYIHTRVAQTASL
jgi:hypothetical protein